MSRPDVGSRFLAGSLSTHVACSLRAERSGFFAETTDDDAMVETNVSDGAGVRTVSVQSRRIEKKTFKEFLSKWCRVGGLLSLEKNTLKCDERAGQVEGGVIHEHGDVSGHAELDLSNSIEHRCEPGGGGYGDDDREELNDAYTAAERSSVKVLEDSNLWPLNPSLDGRLEGEMTQQSEKSSTKMQYDSVSLVTSLVYQHSQSAGKDDNLVIPIQIETIFGNGHIIYRDCFAS